MILKKEQLVKIKDFSFIAFKMLNFSIKNKILDNKFIAFYWKFWFESDKFVGKLQFDTKKSVLMQKNWENTYGFWRVSNQIFQSLFIFQCFESWSWS